MTDFKKIFATDQTTPKKQIEVVVVNQEPTPQQHQLSGFSALPVAASTRVDSHSLIARGVTYLSCDEKDIYVNPWNLINDLDHVETPNLSSQAPVCVNFAADGFPRIEGKPWNGGDTMSGTTAAPSYDPADPATLVSFGLVVNPDGRQDVPVLGFRLRLRVFDTELGTSTVGVRVFHKSYDNEVINALVSVDVNDAEIVIPFFEQNSIISTAGSGDWGNKDRGSTLKFISKTSVRDASYNLVLAEPTEGTATITSIPSFFTVTGTNVYVYVTPILATDENVSKLMAVLKNSPSSYLETLISC